jgi:hypothetical protein
MTLDERESRFPAAAFLRRDREAQRFGVDKE